MIQSMTGYGKSVLQLPTKKVTIEIKSLNSKNLDLNVRIPSYYKEKESSECFGAWKSRFLHLC